MNVAAATEYFPEVSRCELDEGHEGPHTSTVGIIRQWQDVTFKMNFIEAEKK